MENIEDLNKKINKLFRQLGKDVYVNTKSGNLKAKDIEKTVIKIDKNIQAIEALKNKLNSDSNFQDEIKIILTPEKNDEGIGFYFFCKKCRVGNNPASTHCIKCGNPLKS